MATTARKTISALVDSPYQPTGSTHLAHHIEQTEIPLAATRADCRHQDTLCLDCVALWLQDHLFTEPLPWDSTHPTDTDT
ncbi:hypothetical protein [Nocardia thraciensis]